MSAIAAALVHVGVAAGVAYLHVSPLMSHDEAPTRIFDVDIPKPDVPSVEPPARLPPPVTEPPRPPRGPSSASRRSAPVHAAPVVTRLPQSDDPVDLTADGFVTGTAASSLGGQTSASGRSETVAPRVATRPASEPPAVPSPDRSRRASLIGGGEWRCPFPAEADRDDVDHAVVTMQVDLSSDGTVRRVDLLSDPGHGFGEEAQHCAMSKRWSPALDRAGNSVDGEITVRVRFDR